MRAVSTFVALKMATEMLRIHGLDGEAGATADPDFPLDAVGVVVRFRAVPWYALAIRLRRARFARQLGRRLPSSVQLAVVPR